MDVKVPPLRAEAPTLELFTSGRSYTIGAPQRQHTITSTPALLTLLPASSRLLSRPCAFERRTLRAAMALPPSVGFAGGEW